MKKLISLLLTGFITVSFAFAQKSDYYIPVNFKNAYENQTRSKDGNPGEDYWQNRADYKIEVQLFPDSAMISGNEIITYKNNSPNNLGFLIIHLFPNLYKEGAARDFDIDPADDSKGVFIGEITFNGKIIGKNNQSKFTTYQDNNLVLHLPQTLKPGEQAEIGFTWNYRLNKKSHYREGLVDESSFYVAYFFPRIAVYDDIDGWDDWRYTGTAEFYIDFGDFDVAVTVPENYMVWATGLWQNPQELLQDTYFKKFSAAHKSDEIIGIIENKDLKKGNILKQKGKTTWKYKAENVMDFSFGTSDHYLWDATSLVVDSTSNRRVFIDAAYNPYSNDFYKVASIARESIKNMSFVFPAIPFPYPKMTVFNGLSEMEYPMMVNDLSLDDPSETIKLTSHEIFHTYFPFYTGLNETKYAWMDEGLTSYGESIIASKLDPEGYAGLYFMDIYEDKIGYDFDVPLFINSEYLKKPVYYYNSYPKGALFFRMLHEFLGNEKFLEALHTFAERWNGKHPIPHDFIYTFEDVTDEDLSWFIKPWLFEYGYVDFAIKGIEQNKVIIEKVGNYPAPIGVKMTFADGKSQIINYTAAIWNNGNNVYEIEAPYGKEIAGAELLNKLGLDADLKNNFYPAKEK